MTATDITRKADCPEQNDLMQAFFTPLTITVLTGRPAKPSRFPQSVASHPAFTGKFNAKLVAVGMAATMNEHRRMGG